MADTPSPAPVSTPDALAPAPEVQPAQAATPENQDAPTQVIPETPTGANDNKDLEAAMDELQMDDFSVQMVEDLESGDPARIAAALGQPAPESKPKPATAEAAKTPEQAKPEAATTPGGEDDGSSLSRVSIKALPPAMRLKLVTAISKAREGADFEQILRDTFGSGSQPSEPGPAKGPDASGPGPETPRPEAKAPEVARLEAAVAEKKAAYDAARSEYDPKAQDLLEEMMDLKLDLREAQRDAVRHEHEHATFMKAQRESYERVQEQHADLLTDAESPFLDLCKSAISLAEENNDPILQSPDWPEQIAKQVKSKYGKFLTATDANSAAPAGDKPQTPVPPAPQQKVRLPGSPVGNGFAPGVITPETALAEFDKLPPEEQEAAMVEISRSSSRR